MYEAVYCGVILLMIQNRDKYILDQLSKLKPRSKLLGIGDREYIFIVTKIDDSSYEFTFNSSSKSVFKPNSIVSDVYVVEITTMNFRRE